MYSKQGTSLNIFIKETSIYLGMCFVCIFLSRWINVRTEMRKQVPVMLRFARYLIYPDIHVCLHVILLTGAYLCSNKTPHILQKTHVSQNCSNLKVALPNSQNYTVNIILMKHTHTPSFLLFYWQNKVPPQYDRMTNISIFQSSCQVQVPISRKELKPQANPVYFNNKYTVCKTCISIHVYFM